VRLTPPGSDKFVEALVAYGTLDDIANRLGEHLRAGANHVVIQVLGGSDKLLPTLTELAGALGLTPRGGTARTCDRISEVKTCDCISAVKN
jgi:hypothetical protein